MTHTSKEQQEVLPCPFCGGHSTIDSNGKDFRVFCWDCEAKSKEFDCWQKAEAAWNRRTPVVPKGWKLVPEEPTPAMYDRVMREGYYHDNPKAVKAVLRAEYQDMLAAAPQPPEAACNPSMQPELATEAAAEHKALRSVYEAARGLLRYEGVDDGRAITYRTKLASAIEEVKHIDSGLWEPPEAAPVQMPESISKVLEDCRSRAIDYATCPSPYNNTRLETAFQSLEHQVRQLLATQEPST